MKKQHLLALLLVIAGMVTACTKQLTQIPDTSKVLSNFFTTEK